MKWQGRSWQLKTPEINRKALELPDNVITVLKVCLSKEVYREGGDIKEHLQLNDLIL